MKTTTGFLVTCVAITLASGCAERHGRGEPATPPTDGGLSVDGDAPVGHDGGTSLDGVVCGLNVCQVGEICCNELCGLCTEADACPDRGSVERGCEFPTTCGGVTCPHELGDELRLCCPSCDGDVCAPPDVRSRAECPPVECD